MSKENKSTNEPKSQIIKVRESLENPNLPQASYIPNIPPKKKKS